MGLKIANYLFTGPFPLEKAVVRRNHEPAVFAIISKEGEPWNPMFRVLELGETGDDGVVFRDHAAHDHWLETSAGRAAVYLYTMPRRDGLVAADRLKVIENIKATCAPPDGVVSLQGMA